MIEKHLAFTEDQWHELRAKYITASESAILIGQHPYGSPKQLYTESTFKGNAYTKVGQMLEPIVVNVVNQIRCSLFKLYEEEGVKMFYTRGHLGATPDAHDEALDLLLECKTTRPDSFIKYSLNPPTQYLVQLQTQLWCTDKKEGLLAIMSTDMTQHSQELTWPIVIYKVVRNDDLCGIIEQEAKRYYEAPEKFRVQSKVKKLTSVMLHMSYKRI